MKQSIYIFGSLIVSVLLFFVGLFLGYKWGYIPLYEKFMVSKTDIDCQILGRKIPESEKETLLDAIVWTRWRDEHENAQHLHMLEYSIGLQTSQEFLSQVFLVPLVTPAVFWDIVYAQLEDILPSSLTKEKPLEKSKKYIVLWEDISVPLSYMVVYKKDSQDMAQFCVAQMVSE